MLNADNGGKVPFAEALYVCWKEGLDWQYISLSEKTMPEVWLCDSLCLGRRRLHGVREA